MCLAERGWQPTRTLPDYLDLALDEELQVSVGQQLLEGGAYSQLDDVPGCEEHVHEVLLLASMSHRFAGSRAVSFMMPRP